MNNQPIRCRGCRLRIKPPTIAPVAAVKVSSGKPWSRASAPHSDMPPLASSTGCAAQHRKVSAVRTAGTRRISPQPPRPGAGTGIQPATDVPVGPDDDLGASTDRFQTVAQVECSGGRMCCLDVKPVSVIDHLEAEVFRAPGQVNADPAAAGVLDGVLHRLQAAKVGRSLHLTRIATAGRIVDRQRNRRRSGCSQGCRHPFAYQLLGIDTAGKILERSQRLGYGGAKLGRSVRGTCSGSVASSLLVRARLIARASRCCWAPS